MRRSTSRTDKSLAILVAIALLLLCAASVYAGNNAPKAISDAKRVELEGVGHIPHIRAADKFHEALLDFLRSNEPRERTA